MILAIFWAATVATLLARAIRQSYLYRSIPTITDPGVGAEDPEIAVIIPARNEEKNIARCLTALIAQNYPKDKLYFIVVDDNSTDQTAALVSQLAQSDPRIHLIPGQPLTTTWAGKPHACWQGAQVTSSSDWLCFLDADTVANPPLLISAIRAAQNANLSMLSLEPRQELLNFWERLLIPAGMLLLAFTQDISRVNDPHSPHAVANGQFILIRRDVYEKLGGHARPSVRSAICEDTALARLVKSSGYAMALLGAEKLIRTRMYTDFASLWRGISKNATEMLRGLLPTTLCALLGYFLGIASIAIPLLSIRHPLPLTIACAATLALCLTHIATNRHFQIPPLLGILFPLAYLVGSTLLLNAVKMRLRGTVQWKDRTYRAPAAATTDGWSQQQRQTLP